MNATHDIHQRQSLHDKKTLFIPALGTKSAMRFVVLSTFIGQSSIIDAPDVVATAHSRKPEQSLGSLRMRVIMHCCYLLLA